MADPIPKVDWSIPWALLRGYVEEAKRDEKPFSAAELADYMDELKHNALKPVGEWIVATISRSDASAKSAKKMHEGESSA